MTEGKSVGGEAPSGLVSLTLGRTVAKIFDRREKCRPPPVSSDYHWVEEWQTRYLTEGKSVGGEAPSGLI